MKYGYRIVVHKDIPYKDEVKEILRYYLDYFSGENSYKQYWNPLSRNKLGHTYEKDFKQVWYTREPAYLFKRLSCNRRIFGLVPFDKVELFGTLQECFVGPSGRVGKKVKLKIPYQDDIENYITFAEVGEIKG